MAGAPSLYDQTLKMMFTQQSAVDRQMEELKDQASIITCYRCLRSIKAIDSLNDQGAVKTRGVNTRQLDLFEMMKGGKKARKMSGLEQINNQDSSMMMIDTSSRPLQQL